MSQGQDSAGTFQAGRFEVSTRPLAIGTALIGASAVLDARSS